MATEMTIHDDDRAARMRQRYVTDATYRARHDAAATIRRTRRRALMTLLTTHPRLTIREMAAQLGYGSLCTVDADLVALAALGYIDRPTDPTGQAIPRSTQIRIGIGTIGGGL